MLYTKQVTVQFNELVDRLDQAVRDHGFGVLGRIDLKAKLAEKGVPFERDCVVLEVCNPQQAKRVLDQNPAISTSLPCRISVYEQDGKVTVATVKPTLLLEMYAGAQPLAGVAQEVENTLMAIIDAACAPDSR